MGPLGESPSSQSTVAHPAAWFINQLHDGLRCSICAEPIENGQTVTQIDCEKVYSILDPNFNGPIRVVWHSPCLDEWVTVQ